MAAKKKDETEKKVVETALQPGASEFANASQGAGKELGEAALIVAKSVKKLVAPLGAIIWGYEKIEAFLVGEVAKRLKNVPDENRISPEITIGGPIIEALRFAGQNDELRDMFANLLATSMDSETASKAHPAFGEFIKQLSPDEALILKYFAKDNVDAVPVLDVRKFKAGDGGYSILIRNFTHLGKLAGCDHDHLVQSYVDNLCRLEICSAPESYIIEKNSYEPLENDAGVLSIIKGATKEEGITTKFHRRMLEVTTFGKQFIHACIIRKDGES